MSERSRVATFVVGLAALSLAGCGGGSSPSSPSPGVTPGPASSPCDVIGGRALTLSILNGTACSTASSPVVLLNLYDGNGIAAGACSATVIAPRAVLTAGHCFDEGVREVKVWRGSGEQVEGRSFHVHPRYNGSDSPYDIGIVLTERDVERPAVPVLLGRDARVGEQATIAGWGQNESGSSRVLRAGTTTISAVGATLLETRYTQGGSASGVCVGDSGGPILLSEGGAWALGGVTSSISSRLCASGTNYFVSIRNPENRSFILDLVPEASQK